ncbi:MAG: NADH-quinone oxidoreductase subunit A [Pirellulaceae bacterium]|jgi:NADH-quinone oxidoreductase subunit A|nr:NADH-quinone oxidoreductase subunit A [Pirellulaceae bacterium]MDP7014466.1 NADH-quinone oxidoreductase subunit A [Pirellulaceae bacterium]
MSDAVASSLGVVAYLALFAGVGVVFLFVNLLIGSFVRPHDPHDEKLEIYECGEPTIGSSFVQFDLRFYVVALLFIIFDVEIAFFFPWAAVFGKANNMAAADFQVTRRADVVVLTDEAEALYREMGVRNPRAPTTVPASLRAEYSNRYGQTTVNSTEQAGWIVKESARQLAWVTVVDIGVFFAVLIVGFAYVWKRGDLDWVRAVSRERALRAPPNAPIPVSDDQFVSA